MKLLRYVSMTMRFAVLEREILDHMSNRLWPYMTQLDILLFSLLITSAFTTLSENQTVHRRGYCIDLSLFNNAVSTVVFILKRGIGIVKMTVRCRTRHWGKQLWPISRWCHCIVWRPRETLKMWPRFRSLHGWTQKNSDVWFLLPYSSLDSNLSDVFVWIAG
jgi:hypothetical protein